MSRHIQTFEPPFFAFAPVDTAAYRALVARPLPAAKLIALTAPTGYGKTVFLAALHEHYRRTSSACPWLSLDDRDFSIERVLTRLEAAFSSPAAQVHMGQALHQGDEPVEERIAHLLESLAMTAGPTVIFIDNLNHCADETLHRLLDALIFRTPSWVYLVLASTTVLPFDRARALLEGRLHAVGLAELGLDRDGIVQLLGSDLSAQLSPAAIDTIAEQTEGWPAAVRLMQILLSGSSQPEQALARFSGADEDLAALLNRQVLGGFEPGLRQFLLETSLLRSFGVNLCRHVTGDERTAEHIALLLKRNLFVIPLDRNRSWYRLHALFRQFLMDEAAREIRLERRQQVLCRAAEWCEHGGYWQDAVEYALAAESAPLAAAILERIAAMFVRDRGDLHRYIDWVEKLRAMGAECGWEADFWYCWALVFHRRFETARRQTERLSQRVETQIAAGTAPPTVNEFKRRIEVILIAIDTYTDHLADAHRNAMRWLQNLQGDDPFNCATMASAASIHLTSNYQLVEARRVVRLAQSHINQSGSDYGIGWVGLLAAQIALQEGDFATAYQDLSASFTRAKAALGEHAGMTGTLAVVTAKAAVELGLDAEARQLLMLGLRKLQSHGILDTAAHALDAAVKLWDGAPDGAISINQLREIAAAYPPRLAAMLSCLLIRRLVRLGRLEEANNEAAQIGLGQSGKSAGWASGAPDTANARDWRVAAEIDLAIANGQHKQALSLVTAETRQARAEDRFGRLVELALDEATIAQCSHNPAPAARHLTRAVGLAAKRRYLRPFRDRAAVIAGLVNDTKLKDWGFAVEEERRFFSEVCAGLPLTNSVLLEQLGALNIASSLSETPTARELELLGLIDAGLSNQQLADRLSLSVATVKWHLYNLYTKLGVSSRSAALARARALNLLAR